MFSKEKERTPTSQLPYLNLNKLGWNLNKWEWICTAICNLVLFFPWWVKKQKRLPYTIMLWMKCHSLSLETNNKSFSKWHFFICHAFAWCGNPPKYESFIWKKSHARCCDDVCSVFLQSEEFLTQNPKLNSRLLTQTIMAGVQHNTECSLQTVLQEICSCLFKNWEMTGSGF